MSPEFQKFLDALDGYLTGREQGDLTPEDGERLFEAFGAAIFTTPIPRNDPRWVDALRFWKKSEGDAQRDD